jgi:hypothetical protein
VWAGLVAARAEVKSLQGQIDDLNLAEARRLREEELERRRLAVLAEDARLRAVMHFERGEMDKALLDFRRAYSLGASDWEHRDQIAREIEALQAWKDEQ